MKIGILGTGIVGRCHAEKLSTLGHEVVIGTQDVKKTLANTQTDGMGNIPFSDWHKTHGKVRVGTLLESAAFGEVVYNALKGEVSLAALKALKKQLENKVLIDISNPLDFSKGMPPSLSVCNTTSMGEEIQHALPTTKVVKAFNTMNAFLQVDPAQLADADHHLFISGNDDDSKAKVLALAKSYGWKNIIDLGDITTARGAEMMLPIWLRLWGALKTPMFNFKIVEK